MNKEHISLKITPHPSNWPWMRASCCGGRVNHCGPVIQGDEKQINGTHVQDRYCACGKTRITVEGTLEKIKLVGCFGYTEK